MPRIFSVKWAFLGLASFLWVGQAPASSDYRVQIADDQSISFTISNGAKITALKPLKPGLFDLKYIGTLLPAAADSMPYFLFAGNPCKTCAAERALYLIRPSANADVPVITSFVQPGKIRDPKSGMVVMDSQAFYGHCLTSQSKGSDDVYVVFQKERVDRRHSLQSSVFVAEASSDFLREKLIERGMPSLSRTLALVRAKKCHPIETRYRNMVLKPHGLNWRNLQPSDEDDEDRDPDSGEGNDSTPAQD